MSPHQFYLVRASALPTGGVTFGSSRPRLYQPTREKKSGEGAFKEALRFQLSVRTNRTGERHDEKRSSSHHPVACGPPADFYASCFCFQFLLHMWNFFVPSLTDFSCSEKSLRHEKRRVCRRGACVRGG